LQDPAPFHALMAVAAMARDGMQRRPIGAEAFVHKLKAINLINERISNGDIEDSTIRAVNLLWVLEVCIGTFRLSRVKSH
jgi:hypothetical protein